MVKGVSPLGLQSWDRSLRSLGSPAFSELASQKEARVAARPPGPYRQVSRIAERVSHLVCVPQTEAGANCDCTGAGALSGSRGELAIFLCGLGWLPVVGGSRAVTREGGTQGPWVLASCPGPAAVQATQAPAAGYALAACSELSTASQL